VKEVEDAFSILTDEGIIGKIEDAIKEYINENYMSSITSMIEDGMMDVDQDFS
jgi:hypothetical protein